MRYYVGVDWADREHARQFRPATDEKHRRYGQNADGTHHPDGGRKGR